VLSRVSKSVEFTDADEQVLASIVNFMMPKKGLMKVASCKYSNQPQLL
jgi:hypothetical protein